MIDAYLKSKGISSYRASKDTGLSEPTINRYRKGESNPTDNNLRKMFETYTDLESFIKKDLIVDEHADHNSQIPMYNFPTAASGVEMYNDPNDVKVVGYLSIPGAQKGSFALPVHGHSMYPTLESGSWCIVRPIEEKTEIMWGEIYYIEWSDYRVFKRLLEGDKEDEVILWSDNQTEKIGDRAKYSKIVIKKNKIRKLCLLTEILKKPNY
ncbi:LexA family transcriptional regulator [Sphingobacterium sp. LRF_L2]|uniref:LexA family transcriptional regulator n=1 Tax=Sphingobacterium sp. LRF_L2 TaxID=3369421 RepID=UPI003F63DA26